MFQKQVDVLNLVAVLKLGAAQRSTSAGGADGMQLRIGLGFVGPVCPGAAAWAASAGSPADAADGSGGSGFWELQAGEALLSEDADPRFRTSAARGLSLPD